MRIRDTPAIIRQGLLAEVPPPGRAEQWNQNNNEKEFRKMKAASREKSGSNKTTRAQVFEVA